MPEERLSDGQNPPVACAQLRIFLHLKDIECLARGVHANPLVNDLVGRALRLRQLAGSTGWNIILLCDVNEGQQLLDYARAECPQCVEKIRNAAGVTCD